ncbi:MAG TPA: hypothetical protein VGD76_19605 [Ramlibacter sp.]
MSLHYLDFDFSGDEEGHGSFDAMASVAPGQFAALQAEVVRVLGWAERTFGPAAALEEGGEWDYELQGARETSTPLRVQYGAGGLELHDAGPASGRIALSLTLSGTAAFCGALRGAFGLD